MQNLERLLRAKNVLSMDEDCWNRARSASGEFRDAFIGTKNFTSADKTIEIAEHVVTRAAWDTFLSDEYQISLLVDCEPDCAVEVDSGAGVYIRPPVPGTFMFENCARPLQIEGDGPFHSIIVCTTQERVHNLFFELTGKQTPVFDLLYRSSFRDDDLEFLVKGLANACWSGELTQADLDNRIRLIYKRIFEISGNLSNTLAVAENCSPSMARVRDRLMNGLTVETTVSDLAKVAGLSEGHFRRQFRQTFRISAKKLLSELRIEGIKKLLRESPPQTSLSQLAQESGFTCQSHLHREFRKVMKMSPEQYRRQR